MRTLYEKLVRDKIPEIITREGKYPTARTLNDEEYKAELLKKLVEESQETMKTGSGAGLLQELADVKEVYLAILAANGVGEDEVEAARAEKRLLRGGFEKKVFLEFVHSERERE